MRLHWKAFFFAEEGAALVESAIILPVFLALVGGVYEFGFFLYQQQLATSGIEDSARYLAFSADPGSLSVQNEARSLAVTGSVEGGSPRVNGWSTSAVSVSLESVDNSTGAYGGGASIQLVTVSTSFPDRTLGFLALLGLHAPTISVSHQERVIGGSYQGPR